MLLSELVDVGTSDVEEGPGGAVEDSAGPLVDSLLLVPGSEVVVGPSVGSDVGTDRDGSSVDEGVELGVEELVVALFISSSLAAYITSFEASSGSSSWTLDMAALVNSNTPFWYFGCKWFVKAA